MLRKSIIKSVDDPIIPDGFQVEERLGAVEPFGKTLRPTELVQIKDRLNLFRFGKQQVCHGGPFINGFMIWGALSERLDIKVLNAVNMRELLVRQDCIPVDWEFASPLFFGTILRSVSNVYHVPRLIYDNSDNSWGWGIWTLSDYCDSSFPLAVFTG